MTKRRNCYECYFYNSQRGVYEGRSYCEVGYRVNGEGDCKFIDRKDRFYILKYKIDQRFEKIDWYFKLIETELEAINKLIIQLEKEKNDH